MIRKVLVWPEETRICGGCSENRGIEKKKHMSTIIPKITYASVVLGSDMYVLISNLFG